MHEAAEHGREHGSLHTQVEMVFLLSFNLEQTGIKFLNRFFFLSLCDRSNTKLERCIWVILEYHCKGILLHNSSFFNFMHETLIIHDTDFCK